MSPNRLLTNNKDSTLVFAAGWAAVMLALWINVIPAWDTYIHMWRTELASSILLGATLAYLTFRESTAKAKAIASGTDLAYLVAPIAAFIAWSFLSVLWAPSWKSALHHSLVWGEYLIFFLIVRQLVETTANYDRLLLAVVVSLVLFGIPVVFEYCAFLVLGGATTLGIRFAKFGEQINTVYPLAMLAVVRLKGKHFAAGVAAIVCMWLLIFCSFSRIGMFLFGFSTVAIVLSVLVFKQLREFRTKVAIVVLAMVIAPFPLHIAGYFADSFDVPMMQRLSDDNGAISSSNNFRKLMASLAIEMFSAKPVIGIGADNFGMQLNNYRAAYSSKHPDDVNLAAAEADIPERAHNEYLQILAELGSIGAIIFLAFLFGIAAIGYRAVRARRVPIEFFAAALGLGMFLASSLVTSYSFRLIQNGFVFFFVLAVFARSAAAAREEAAPLLPASRSRIPYYAAGLAACLALGAYSVVRVTSVIYTKDANYIQNTDESAVVYEKAVRLDSENPDASNILGMRLLREHRFAEAVPHLQKSIALGKAPSPDLSYLATAQQWAGDCPGALETLRSAAALYPRSPFVLTRYAQVLRKCGDSADSQVQLDRAVALDNRAANTWWSLMNDGARAASDLAARDKNYCSVMELQPQAAIYAVMTEREILNPAEKFKFEF
jgi:O-antigen ligase/Tfp pilus assembly protein PilF